MSAVLKELNVLEKTRERRLHVRALRDSTDSHHSATTHKRPEMEQNQTNRPLPRPVDEGNHRQLQELESELAALVSLRQRYKNNCKQLRLATEQLAHARLGVMQTNSSGEASLTRQHQHAQRLERYRLLQLQQRVWSLDRECSAYRSHESLYMQRAAEISRKIDTVLNPP